MSRRKNFLESHNPVMKEEAYRKAGMAQVQDGVIQRGEVMTVQGAINKSFLLLALLVVMALVSYMNPNPLFIWGGAIGGLVVVLVSVFKKEWSPFTAPLYAVLEGLFVGGISAMYASFYEGIIFNAVSLTIGLLFMMLFIYKTGIIKVTNKFRTGVIMATGAVFLIYLISFALSFFGLEVPFLHDTGWMGIGISLVIIGIACLNLLLDFDNFEKGEQHKAPIYMEWFSAMGLIITLVWLYIEILRLLAIFSSGD
jgi:uncharacterized YccA/Bax inhibitor family protein